MKTQICKNSGIMPRSVYRNVYVCRRVVFLYKVTLSSTDGSPGDRLTTLLSVHKTFQEQEGVQFPFLVQLLLCKLNIPYDTNSKVNVSKCSEKFHFLMYYSFNVSVTFL